MSAEALETPIETPLGARLILVEDDDSLRESLLEYLGEHGFRAAGAASAAEGLRLLDAETDVVITDLKLPDGSGLDVLRQVRQRSRLRAA